MEPGAQVTADFRLPAECTGYLAATAAYDGPKLFVALSKPRCPMASDTINASTTKFLKAHKLQGFTAHSTRGAAVTALILLGTDPHTFRNMWPVPLVIGRLMTASGCSLLGMDPHTFRNMWPVPLVVGRLVATSGCSMTRVCPSHRC